jgi:hypothetical protein
MKINASFIDALFQCLNQMGDGIKKADFSLGTAAGIEVKLSEITQYAGLLNYKGQQVVVFIPDHSYEGVPFVVQNPKKNGRKYHFAECETLSKMRISGRYKHRYHVHQNIDGEFKIFDDNNHHAIVELAPCQNCLKHVNYQGINHASWQDRRDIINRLTLKVLFATYSTLFKELPTKSSARTGYSADWKSVSIAYREKKNYVCEQCGVQLRQHKELLHTHHKDGNKHNNQEKNLQALCIDCHRKQHLHDHLFITQSQMAMIQALREEQHRLNINDWEDVFALVDEAYHGLLHHYLATTSESVKPSLRYHIVTTNQAIIADMAWPGTRLAYALHVTANDKARAKQQGWQLLNLNEAFVMMNP